MKGRFSSACSPPSESTARSRSPPTLRPAGNCCSTASMPRAISRSTTRRSTRCARLGAADRNRTLDTAAGPRLRRGVQPAAALLHRRRGAYRPAAGADAGADRLSRDRHRSARILCHRGALSRRRADHRMAGRGAGAAEARPALGGRDPDPRPQARRSGAGRGAALGVLLHRRARLEAHPCRTLRAA